MKKTLSNVFSLEQLVKVQKQLPRYFQLLDGVMHLHSIKHFTVFCIKEPAVHPNCHKARQLRNKWTEALTVDVLAFI